jgi:hypothetical protein
VEDFATELEKVQKTFKKRKVRIYKPHDTDFPELLITVPDSWKQIQLAPLYDVHYGSKEHDRALFTSHLKWIAETSDVLTFNGGDMFDNGNKIAPGASSTSQDVTPEEQLHDSVKILAPIQHKTLFYIPGNHEDRTLNAAGIDVSRVLADNLKLPYFPDYCFCTIKWRGNQFRLLAHHGSGGASTAGAQRNAARKDMPWAKFDILWTGHLHQPMADIAYQIDFDQKTGRVFERCSVVMISPSYLKYFGSYAAKKRLAPGMRGLGVIILQEDGRIDVSLHARGKRL